MVIISRQLAAPATASRATLSDGESVRDEARDDGPEERREKFVGGRCGQSKILKILKQVQDDNP